MTTRTEYHLQHRHQQHQHHQHHQQHQHRLDGDGEPAGSLRRGCGSGQTASEIVPCRRTSLHCRVPHVRHFVFRVVGRRGHRSLRHGTDLRDERGRHAGPCEQNGWLKQLFTGLRFRVQRVGRQWRAGSVYRRQALRLDGRLHAVHGRGGRGRAGRERGRRAPAAGCATQRQRALRFWQSVAEVLGTCLLWESKSTHSSARLFMRCGGIWSLPFLRGHWRGSS
mmetsp:Transcript_17592/g.45889  ORF Transcript_17592/g.45889 Transcript_17592/m.45889 type:complete len:223 (-) Transcript_17592:98-766(-)